VLSTSKLNWAVLSRKMSLKNLIPKSVNLNKKIRMGNFPCCSPPTSTPTASSTTASKKKSSNTLYVPIINVKKEVYILN